MVESCQQRGVYLASGVMVSSHPDYRRAYELAAGGAIGQVQRINLYGGNGQGGCHGLNLTRKFAAKAPAEWVVGQVEGDPHSDHEEPYEEGATGFGGVGGYIRFGNGIECFSSFPGPTWRGLEVVGSEGLICNWNNTGLGFAPVQAQRSRWPFGRGGRGVRAIHRGGKEGTTTRAGRIPGAVMRAIVEDIVRVLEEGGDLAITSGDDLRHALELAIALRQSHRQGSVQVSLPLADRSSGDVPGKDALELQERSHRSSRLYGADGAPSRGGHLRSSLPPLPRKGTTTMSHLPAIQIETLTTIRKDANHNAFTDLCSYAGRFYLTFRSSPDGHGISSSAWVVVLESDDGRSWSEAFTFCVPRPRHARSPLPRLQGIVVRLHRYLAAAGGEPPPEPQRTSRIRCVDRGRIRVERPNADGGHVRPLHLARGCARRSRVFVRSPPPRVRVRHSRRTGARVDRGGNTRKC